MKRFLALFLTIVMLVTTLGSCGFLFNKNEETTTDDGGTIMPPKELSASEILEGLNPTQLFDATFGCKEAIIKDVTSIDAIRSAFTNEGFTKLDVDMVEGAQLETILLTKGEELVTLYWIASEKEVRITLEKVNEAALAALQKNDSTGDGTLTMVQIGVERVSEIDNPNIGLCYIFKLSNGSAIILDGGHNNELCAENIYKALAKLEIAKNEDNKYKIEAWVFTHGHSDHNGVLYSFAPYAPAVDVSYFLYQLPNNEAISVDVGKVGVEGEEAFHKIVKAAFPKATILNPHTGLNYYFGNATISMLYTPDLLWNTEEPIDYYNDNSLIFKVSGGNTAFLCMGDAGEKAAKRSWKLFDASAYESGIFQVSHHGLTTGANNSTAWDNIKNIYEATGAETVALPLGTTYAQGGRNGRYSVIFQNGYHNQQMSYIVNKGNGGFSGGYFNAAVWDAFIYDAENGTNRLVQEFGLVDKTLYGHDGINMIDNNDGIITYIAASDKAEMATVFQFAKGKVTVKKNEKLDDWLKQPDFTVSEIITSVDKDAQTFESSFGTKEVVFKDIADKDTIVSLFTRRGFESVRVNPIEGAKIETLLFTNGAELATVYWKPAENEARILVEKLDDNILPVLTSNKTTGTGELTMVQVGIQRDPSDTGSPMIGMCYVIKLSDGRAIIIDGGFNYESNADNVYNTLSKLNIQKNDADQYVIAAWFFSHGDGDHIGIASSFGEKYADKVDIEYFVYNLPSTADLSPTSSEGEKKFHEACIEEFPNTTLIVPRAGIQYFFGNATIDMLYTPDLVWSPESKITYYNSTSLIFMVNGGGASFLSTGDAGESAFTAMWNSYESSAFACDIFQYPHHGLTTQENTGEKYSEYTWVYIKKVFEATGAKYAVLPMGDRHPNNSYNGRATEMIFRGNAKTGISYLLNMSDKHGVDLSKDVYEAFVKAVAEGTNTHETYLGYNGINMLKSAQGLITYMSGSELDPMATVFSLADGTLTVVDNKKLYDWLAEPTKVDSFESTFDSEMEIYANVKSSELFTAPLVADGYKILDVTMIEGAKFETILLQKGTSLVTLYWFAESGDLRIAYDTIQESATAPLSPNEETGKGELIVAQVGVDVKEPGNQNSTENNPNIGLCYIFKLSNGHAIIIDGGYYYQSNADNIYKSLVSLDIAKDSNGKYVVEAWIFTHGHGDHNGATAFFFPSYSQKVDVKNFVYQLPTNKEISPTGAGYAGEEAFHELCKTTYPNANYINPRTGLTYYFGNAEVDMFHTPDSIWSHTDPIPDYNDSGIIFRVTGGGVEGALFMGDSGEHPSTATVKNYDASAFNSNIVQISHHGLNTQINEGHEWKKMKVIYEGATAEYAFLPMGVAKPNVRSGRWSVLCGWGYNGKQASFVINANDDDRGVDQTAWNTFVSGILDGSLEGETLLGYNGHNIIDNGQGRITYIHCSETDPMVTIMSFKDGKITVELNQELYDWFEETK